MVDELLRVRRERKIFGEDLCKLPFQTPLSSSFTSVEGDWRMKRKKSEYFSPLHSSFLDSSCIFSLGPLHIDSSSLSVSNFCEETPLMT